jgi:hypothetical protein
MLRKLQLSSKKLKELWELDIIYEEKNRIKYFGKPPYDFIYDIDNPIPYANKFGKYGKELKNYQNILNKLPTEFKELIDDNDIGKFIDDLNREYIGAFNINEFTVRLPRGNTNFRSDIPFPEFNEIIKLRRRNNYINIKIIDIGNIRKATALIKVEFLII